MQKRIDYDLNKSDAMLIDIVWVVQHYIYNLFMEVISYSSQS